VVQSGRVDTGEGENKIDFEDVLLHGALKVMNAKAKMYEQREKIDLD